jgi:dihydroorotate dehydrogenase
MRFFTTTALRTLHRLPPEMAHALALRALRTGLVPAQPVPRSPCLRATLFGRDLPHPLGLAAGFDKNGEAVPGLFRLGFATIEIGTVTPRPQAGNPKPRLFRLPGQHALINRLGFNNLGLEAMREQLRRSPRPLGLLGANIGPNRGSDDPLRDYLLCLEGLYELVDYVAINVSSPNTPGLRQLQGRDALGRLLEALIEARARLAGGAPPKPLAVKIAPDLERRDEEAIAEVVLEKGADGLIVSNTTITRPGDLASDGGTETGGLSGPPLFARSTALLTRMYRLTSGRVPLIGVGGISTGTDAYAKIRAGASALQLYTGLVYRGPGIVGAVLADLEERLKADGFASVTDAIGADAQTGAPADTAASLA